MIISIKENNEYEVKYIKVSAQVRYWEDAEINGDTSEDGENVPFKNGSLWEPVIDVDNGCVVGWPNGVTASFHFKVCDAGSYHLLDCDKNAIASIENNYVPNGLCHGSEGWGDYIIFDVDDSGNIKNYKNKIDLDDWQDEI